MSRRGGNRFCVRSDRPRSLEPFGHKGLLERHDNSLYFSTGLCLILGVLAGTNFAFSAIAPIADSPNALKKNVYRFGVAESERGLGAQVLFSDGPLTVWRRDLDQKRQAIERLGLAASEERWLLDRLRNGSVAEVEPGTILHVEWFIVSPVHIGGTRCVVLCWARAFDGFLDLCLNVQFDLVRVCVARASADGSVCPTVEVFACCRCDRRRPEGFARDPANAA